MIKAIKILALFQGALLLLWLVSFELFINAEVAFFSAFFIMMGSMYSYSRLVNKRLAAGEGGNDEMLEKIDDPYDLYDEGPIAEQPSPEDVDIKAVIKEEKKRLKANTGKNVKTTAPAMVSLFRLVPYIFLVLGFIGLKNNDLLALWPYLIALGVGVVAGLMTGKSLFVSGSPEEA